MLGRERDSVKSGRKRPLVAALLAAFLSFAAVLAAGVAFARFSGTQQSQTNSFSSGTVSLSSSTTGHCTVSNMLPGASPSPCTMTASYTGSAPAYMAVNVLIETQAGNGGTKLYNPTDATHHIQVAISSTSPSVAAYTVPATVTTCPGGAPAGSTCYEVDNQLVSTTAFTSSSPTVTFTTTASLPSGTTTGYRGGSAQIILTAHAAQSANNTATGCTAGAACSAVHWS